MVKSRDIIHKPRRPKLPENISIPCGPFRASCLPQTLNKGWSRNLHEIFLSGRHILPCELKAFFYILFTSLSRFKSIFQKNSISCIDLKAECQKKVSNNGLGMLFVFFVCLHISRCTIHLASALKLLQFGIRMCDFFSREKSEQTAEICFRKSFRFFPAGLNWSGKCCSFLGWMYLGVRLRDKSYKIEWTLITGQLSVDLVEGFFRSQSVCL